MRDLRPLGRRVIRPVPAAFLLAAVLHLLWWWLLANSGGDIAAQDAWAEFAREHPGSAYNLAWYGGMHPVSYSIVSPYVMALLGVRTTMMVAGTVSSALLALLLVRSNALRQPLWPALYGAVALTGNAVSGRVTFGLGTMFALAALVVVLTPRHHVEGRRLPRRRGRGAGRAGDGRERPGRALPRPDRRGLVPAAPARDGVRARGRAGRGGGPVRRVLPLLGPAADADRVDDPACLRRDPRLCARADVVAHGAPHVGDLRRHRGRGLARAVAHRQQHHPPGAAVRRRAPGGVDDLDRPGPTAVAALVLGRAGRPSPSP